jgi:hypothetical protein
MNQAAIFRDTYDLAFQKSPIVLTGGTVGWLPIVALLGNLAGLLQGGLSSGNLSMSDFYATFIPLPGTSVINISAATYPFADQHVAANAVIDEPLGVSLQMIVPVKNTAGYLTKLPLFLSIRNALYHHQMNGGLFSVATPSYIYDDCILNLMNDITNSETKQQQIEWQLDFIQPLVSQNQAQAAMNSTMNAISGGTKLTAASNMWQAGAQQAVSAASGIANNVSGLFNGFPT